MKNKKIVKKSFKTEFQFQQEMFSQEEQDVINKMLKELASEIAEELTEEMFAEFTDEELKLLK
jgi:hypothetical protein